MSLEKPSGRSTTMRLVLTLDAKRAQSLERLLAACNRSDCSSHGALTLERLAYMLLEDAALIVTRPGSWEGVNMSQVLESHGYLLR